MKAGTIFVVTSGEYSDYGLSGTFRARCDFWWNDVLEAWLKTNEKQSGDYHGDFRAFLKHLETEDLVEHVTIPKIHIGDYGTFERHPEDVKETADAPTWVLACLAHDDCRKHPEIGAACEQRTAAATSQEKK